MNKNPKTIYDIRYTIYGFTIVELVLVIALLGIIGTVIGFVLKESLKSFTLITARKDSLADARRAIERMKSELRIAMNIDSMSATSLQFDTTTENNIAYAINGTDLERNGNDIAQNVNALTLTYLDAAGNITAFTAQVRRVQLDITVSTASHGSDRLRSQVYLRRYYYINFQ